MKQVHGNLLSYLRTFIAPMVFSLTRSIRIRKLLITALICIVCVVCVARLFYPTGVDLVNHNRSNSNRSLRVMTTGRLERESGRTLDEKEKVPNARPTMWEHFQQTRQQLRKEQIHRVCKTLNASGQLLSANKTMTPSQFSSIYVDDNRHILYCSIPKVACTNWKRVLLILSGKMNTTQTIDLRSDDVHGKLEKTFLRKLSNYTMEEIQQRLNTYYKFLFVREPFERILSAYLNKFTTDYNYVFRRAFGRRIIKLYRDNQSQGSVEDGRGVTFDEFVAYLLDPRTTKQRPFNQHWRQYYELCHPCFIQYNAIGKYETIQEDTDFILRQLRVTDLVTFPPYQKRVKTFDLLAQKFANISSDDIHRLWKLYSIDFDLFDYPYPNIGLTKSSM